MDKKKLILLIAALVVAAGTAFAARTIMVGASAPTVQAAQADVPTGPKVLVAQRALPVGTIITADSVSFQAWPKEMVQDAYFIDGEADMSKLLGTVVRFPVTAGEPVTKGVLVAPGDRGFLAAALGPGMRAVTITVSAKTGVAGFIFPGDRVDLMLTQSLSGDGQGGSLNAAETILKNLRVLATDQSTESETAENGKTVVRSFNTVTLEVTPRIAEKIAVADTIGALRLSLRSIADNQSELDRAIASGAIKVPDGATKAEEDRLLAKGANGPMDGATTFVTGGDVSRFQRRSIPRQQSSAPTPSVPVAVAAAPASPFDYPRGPVIRVTRGKSTTVEAVGGK